MKRRTKIKRPAKKAAAKRTHTPKADRLAGSIADRILAELAEIKAQQAEIKALVLAGKSPRRNWSRKFKGPKTPAMADMLNGFDKYMEAKGFPKDDTKEIRRHAIGNIFTFSHFLIHLPAAAVAGCVCSQPPTIWYNTRQTKANET